MAESSSENVPPKQEQKLEKKENPELTLTEAHQTIQTLVDFKKLVSSYGKITIEEKDTRYEITPVGLSLDVKKMAKDGKVLSILHLFYDDLSYASMSLQKSEQSGKEEIAHIEKKYTTSSETGERTSPVKFETYNGRVMKNKIDELVKKTQDMFAAKKAAEEKAKIDAEKAKQEKIKKEASDKVSAEKEEERRNIADQIKADKEQKARFTHEKAEEAKRAEAEKAKQEAQRREAEEAKKKAEAEKAKKAQDAKEF